MLLVPCFCCMCRCLLGRRLAVAFFLTSRMGMLIRVQVAASFDAEGVGGLSFSHHTPI